MYHGTMVHRDNMSDACNNAHLSIRVGIIDALIIVVV